MNQSISNPYKFYKIKVGIEEFAIDEKDIPRIVQAMKTNDMVQLDVGIFRGNAILALCRDIEKEMSYFLLQSKKKTKEEILEENRKVALENQMRECMECIDHKGYIHVKKGRETVAVPCKCTVIRDLDLSPSKTVDKNV